MDEPTDDTTPGGDDAPAPVREGRMARLERALAPKPAPERSVGAKGGNPTKWSVDRLDGRERLYCYAASGIAVVFALLIYVGETSEKHFHPAKNQFSPTTALLVGLGSAVLLAVATWIGRRAVAGFMALFTFLAFENSAMVIGIPFLVLAGWLLYRSYKVQKEATAKLRAEREASGTGTSDRRDRTPRGSAAAGRAAASDRAGRKKAPTGPEANKRYTPKKPAPKPVPEPKPSWRERRAAKASD